MFENKGYCPCCDQNTIFRSEKEWLRDYYLCSNCGCIPREHALMKVIEMFYPNWRELSIHESSPVNRGTSLKLRTECKRYPPTQYWPDREVGMTYGGIINVNLEKQLFEKDMFDLVITQDVFEHLYDPESAVKEIYRTLKPNGSHICTVPLVNKSKPTEKWSILRNGEVLFLHKPEYHGNPVDPKGSPVSYHYGYDFAFLVQSWASFSTTMAYIDDITYGIRAEYIEVMVMKKNG